MGFLDTILGRSKPAQPNLDELFSLPTAAITLEAGMNLKPTGTGSVCFRAAEGKAFGDIEKDVRELLSMGADSASVKVSTDSYGYTWLTCEHAPDDFEALVTDLHAVNSSLQAGGFGPQLLCTLVTFTSDTVHRLGIVYLYKQGTFYPFAPKTGQQRDNAVELQVRGSVGADLKIEPDLTRWFAVWGAPGL
jgi:hypothetical protein